MQLQLEDARHTITRMREQRDTRVAIYVAISVFLVGVTVGLLIMVVSGAVVLDLAGLNADVIDTDLLTVELSLILPIVIGLSGGAWAITSRRLGLSA
jgi:hypothetical protein